MGELFSILIYGFLIIFILTFIILLWYRKTNKRIILLVFSSVLLFAIWFSDHLKYKQNQTDQIGLYYLTDFPNCKACYIELKEDMTYEVINDNIISEKGNWHFEEGSDFDITYINEHEQLGNGRFMYKEYKLKNAKQKN